MENKTRTEKELRTMWNKIYGTEERKKKISHKIKINKTVVDCTYIIRTESLQVFRFYSSTLDGLLISVHLLWIFRLFCSSHFCWRLEQTRSLALFQLAMASTRLTMNYMSIKNINEKHLARLQGSFSRTIQSASLNGLLVHIPWHLLLHYSK